MFASQKLQKMDLHVHENPMENNNMKDMVHKNSVEKLENIKRQRSLEKQKRYFVRQHSRDENEIKQILQRLQFEQQIHDYEQKDTSLISDTDENEKEEDDKDNDDCDEGLINPYPLIIVPKFGPPTPLKNSNTDTKSDHLFHGLKPGRRKSLEFEDMENGNILETGRSPIRTTVLAYSFINKLKAPIAVRKSSNTHDQGPLIDNNMWVGDPEYISSIRRPRKTVAELIHNKSLKRAKSELWLRSELSLSTSSLRPDSPRLRKISADDVLGRNSEFRKDSMESNDKDSPTEMRKSSHENKISTNQETSPDACISPCISKRGSLKSNKKDSEKKSNTGNLKQNIISVEITRQRCYEKDSSEGLLRPPGRVKEDTKKFGTSSEPIRKSSLKKKKYATDREHESICESGNDCLSINGKIENSENTHDKTRKISFADQDIMTQNSSLKNIGKKKAVRKLGIVTSPGSLKDSKHSPGSLKDTKHPREHDKTSTTDTNV